MNQRDKMAMAEIIECLQDGCNAIFGDYDHSSARSDLHRVHAASLAALQQSVGSSNSWSPLFL